MGDPLAINNYGQMAGRNGHAVLFLLSAAFGLPAGVQDLHPTGTIFTYSQANGLNNAPNGVLSTQLT